VRDNRNAAAQKKEGQKKRPRMESRRIMNEEKQQEQPPQQNDESYTYMPLSGGERPVQNDAEIAKMLLDMEGKTAVTRTKFPVFDNDGKQIGWRIGETENTFVEMLNRDLSKSNLNQQDLRIARQIRILASYVQSVSIATMINYRDFQKLLADIDSHWINTARAKGGWAAELSKTSKTTKQEMLEQELRQFDEEKKKPRWKFW